jgi:hypothetical protein
VTLDPELASQIDLVQRAVDAWNSKQCGFCFAPVMTRQNLPDPRRAERRVHVQFNAAQPETTSVIADISYELHTGRLLNVNINIRPDALQTLEPFQFTHELGHAAGLADAVGVDSIMQTVPSVSAPKTADAQALCALYGDAPYCAE